MIAGEFYGAAVLFLPGILILFFTVSRRCPATRMRKIRRVGAAFITMGVLLAASAAGRQMGAVCGQPPSLYTPSLTKALCASMHDQNPTTRAFRIVVGQQPLQAEMVDTPQGRARGLMFRRSLAHGHGMLFLFAGDVQEPFWMKNTLIPLDMLFFNSQGALQDVIRKVPPCKADPCPSYRPSHVYRYVLELPSGEAQRLGLRTGDRLSAMGRS